MKAHELYKLALQGRLPVDQWSADDIAEAAKFDLGAYDRIPKWLVKAGHALIGSAAARLPAERTIMEFETPGERFDRLALLCSQGRTVNQLDVICHFTVLRFRGRWRKPVVVDTPGGSVAEALGISLFHAGIAALQLHGSLAEDVAPDEAANQSRAWRQRPPLFAYARVPLTTKIGS